MSRGVVLWPDDGPHCSLSVAAHLPADEALRAVGVVSAQPIPLRVESVAVFPPAGALVLACVANGPLLAEQRRVHEALRPLAVDPWPHFELDGWVPHITLSTGMTHEQLATAVPIVLEALPLSGNLDRGGVEDGTTGEHWPAS